MDRLKKAVFHGFFCLYFHLYWELYMKEISVLMREERVQTDGMFLYINKLHFATLVVVFFWRTEWSEGWYDEKKSIIGLKTSFLVWIKYSVFYFLVY